MVIDMATNSTIDVDAGAEIRRLREAANVPLVELAAEVEIDDSYLSLLERGERAMNVRMYYSLRIALIDICDRKLKAVQ